MNIDSTTNRMQRIETLLTIRNMLFKIRTGDTMTVNLSKLKKERAKNEN